MTAHGRRQALACVTTALLLAGSACGSEEGPRAQRSPAKSTTSASPSSPTSSPSYSSAPSASGSTSDSAAAPTRSFAVPVYYLGDTRSGVRLFREFHRVVATEDMSTRMFKALQLALHDSASDPDYHTGWPHGTTLRGASDDRRAVQIVLSGPHLAKRPAGMSKAEARQALNALVYTADGVVQTAARVFFTTPGGRTLHRLLGVHIGDLLTRADPDRVKSPVSIFSPTQGALASSPVKVTGEAATFEANVVWELMRGAKVVKHGVTTAKECCTLSPYAFTVKAPPGDYTLVVHDVDESGGEGAGTGQDTKDITIR